MKILIALIVIAVWVGLTSLAAWATPERRDSEEPPDLVNDIIWLNRLPDARGTPETDFTDFPIPTTTTSSSTTTTTTRPRPPPTIPRPAIPRVPNTGGAEQWRSLVAQYSDWNVDTMLAIIRCESGGRPDARNPSSGAAGLTQIYPAQAGSFDPATNIAQAHAKWLGARGYSPWVSSRSCWG